MDIRQLVGNDFENGQMQFSAKQANIWTALPGIIQTYDALKMTCTVQPAIQAVLFDANGIPKNTTLPLLVDCPIQFPSGGNCTITFPINPGDECLIVFSSRCIDAWWQSSGVQPQAELRLHDLSDGFVILGYRSVPRVLTNISLTAIQIRSDAGDTFIELNPTTKAVTMTVPGNVNITAPTTTITGDVHITGDVQVDKTLTATTDVIGGGIHLKTHKHGGVTTGSGQTGVPV